MSARCTSGASDLCGEIKESAFEVTARRGYFRQLNHCEEASVQQDGDTVSHPFDLTQNMRRDNDRTLCGEFTQQPAHFDDLSWVKAIGGFIENQHFWFV